MDHLLYTDCSRGPAGGASPRRDPLDKAGSYGVQGPASLFVDHLEGNYFNIIGMPAPTLYEMLLNARVIDQQHRVL